MPVVTYTVCSYLSHVTRGRAASPALRARVGLAHMQWLRRPPIRRLLDHLVIDGHASLGCMREAPRFLAREQGGLSGECDEPAASSARSMTTGELERCLAAVACARTAICAGERRFGAISSERSAERESKELILWADARSTNAGRQAWHVGARSEAGAGTRDGGPAGDRNS